MYELICLNPYEERDLSAVTKSPVH